MPDEKRRFMRIFFSIKGKLTVGNKSYDVEKIENLGIGGCLITINEKFEKGAECTLAINLCEEKNVTVEGTILRCLEKAVAVQFAKIDTDSLFHLQNIIRYNSNNVDKVEQEIQKHPGLV